jgi:hypothetical protein
VNPDGSTTFETPGAGAGAGEEQFQGEASGVPPEVMEEIVRGTDPAFISCWLSSWQALRITSLSFARMTKKERRLFSGPGRG